MTQAATLAVSVTMFVALFPEDARTYEVGSEKEDRVKLQRGVQVAAGAAFWGSVIYGVLDAQHLWRAERARPRVGDADRSPSAAVSDPLSRYTAARCPISAVTTRSARARRTSR